MAVQSLNTSGQGGVCPTAQTAALRAYRAGLEDIITLALALLDASDVDPDLEDEPLEDDDGEASAQMVTLCPDVVPLRRLDADRTAGSARLRARRQAEQVVRDSLDPATARLLAVLEGMGLEVPLLGTQREVTMDQLRVLAGHPTVTGDQA